MFCSSCSVYGHRDETVDENSELNPTSYYAELKIEQESLDLQNQVLEQQIALQVAQEYYNWRTKVANLTTQEAAIDAALTSYNATLNRYKNDKAILIEVISAQNRLINSRLNKLLAVIDIHIAVAALEKTIFQQ